MEDNGTINSFRPDLNESPFSITASLSSPYPDKGEDLSSTIRSVSVSTFASASDAPGFGRFGCSRSLSFSNRGLCISLKGSNIEVIGETVGSRPTYFDSK